MSRQFNESLPALPANRLLRHMRYRVRAAGYMETETSIIAGFSRRLRFS